MTTFTLRLSDELNTWLEQQARLNRRSKNKQIEHILEMARRMPLFNAPPARDLRDILMAVEEMKDEQG